jgi:tetratricopeptide (TPR) repeat protein
MADKSTIFEMIEEQVDRGLVGLNATVKAELREQVVEVAEQAAFEAGEGVDAAKLLYGVGCVLFDMQRFGRALPLLKQALYLQKRHFGADAIETLQAVYKIGEASSKISNLTGMPWYERSLQISKKQHGKLHVCVARSLIGMARVHGTDGDQAKRIEFCRRAIKLVQAAPCAGDHVDVHVEALSQIGTAQFVTEEWTDCLDSCNRSIRLHEAKHGQGRTATAASLCIMATVYGKLGLHDKEMEVQLQVLRIQEEARGPLSREAGLTYGNLGSIHYNAQQFAESAAYLRRAVDAMVFTFGADARDTNKYLKCLEMAVNDMDPAHPKADEYRAYLEAVRQQAILGNEAKLRARTARANSRESMTAVPGARVQSHRGGMRGQGLRMMPALGRRPPPMR